MGKKGADLANPIDSNLEVPIKTAWSCSVACKLVAGERIRCHLTLHPLVKPGQPTTLKRMSTRTSTRTRTIASQSRKHLRPRRQVRLCYRRSNIEQAFARNTLSQEWQTGERELVD